MQEDDTISGDFWGANDLLQPEPPDGGGAGELAGYQLSSSSTSWSSSLVALALGGESLVEPNAPPALGMCDDDHPYSILASTIPSSIDADAPLHPVDLFPQAHQSQFKQQHLQQQPVDAAGKAAAAATGATTDDATRDALREAIRHAFDMVEDTAEHHWARDFILEQAPQDTAQMIVNAAALPHSVAIDLTGTHLEADGQHSGYFDARIDLNGLFVPVFSAGHLTVGAFSNSFHRNSGGGLLPVERFGTAPARIGSEGAADHMFNEPMWRQLTSLNSTIFSLGRYVRDTRDGRLLIVKHTGPFSANQPSVMTKVIFINSISSTRNERINIACDGPLFRSGKLLESVKFCIRTRESRFCPLCSAPPNARCQCMMPVYLPRHNLDFSANSETMKRFEGEFLGTTKAIVAVSPAQSAPTSVCFPQEPYVRASLVSNFRIDAFGRSHARHSDLSSMLQSFAVQFCISEMGPDRPLKPSEGLEGIASGSGTGSTGVSAAMVCSNSYVDEALRGNSSLVQVPVLGMDSSMARMQKSPMLTLADGQMSAPRMEENALSLFSGWPECMEQHNKVVVPGAAAVTASFGRGGCEDQSLRDARRRERNRQAAARSNARRKLKNENLKRGLREGGQALEVLRDKERRLREENLALRQRLYAMASKPSGVW
jgi:hypothetical protein